MSNVKGAQPTVPTLPSKPVAPKVQVGDMEHFHKMATSGELSDILLKMGGGKRT